MGKKYPHGCPKKNPKNQNKKPLLLFYTGDSQRENFALLLCDVVGKEGSGEPFLQGRNKGAPHRRLGSVSWQRRAANHFSTCLGPGPLCPLSRPWALWNVGYLNIESSDKTTITFFFFSVAETEVKSLDIPYDQSLQVEELGQEPRFLWLQSVCGVCTLDFLMTAPSAMIWGLALALPAWFLREALPVLNSSETAFSHSFTR